MIHRDFSSGTPYISRLPVNILAFGKIARANDLKRL